MFVNDPSEVQDEERAGVRTDMYRTWLGKEVGGRGEKDLSSVKEKHIVCVCCGGVVKERGEKGRGRERESELFLKSESFIYLGKPNPFPYVFHSRYVYHTQDEH